MLLLLAAQSIICISGGPKQALQGLMDRARFGVWVMLFAPQISSCCSYEKKRLYGTGLSLLTTTPLFGELDHDNLAQGSHSLQRHPFSGSWTTTTLHYKPLINLSKQKNIHMRCEVRFWTDLCVLMVRFWTFFLLFLAFHVVVCGFMWTCDLFLLVD